jgi:hypothetical protein
VTGSSTHPAAAAGEGRTGVVASRITVERRMLRGRSEGVHGNCFAASREAFSCSDKDIGAVLGVVIIGKQREKLQSKMMTNHINIRIKRRFWEQPNGARESLSAYQYCMSNRNAVKYLQQKTRPSQCEI